MGGSDRTILLVIPLIAVVGAFWYFGLSPKQDDVKKLDESISKLELEVAAQEQAVVEGQRARAQFPRDYHSLVVMGKAVPVDDETASLLVQLNTFADRSDVEFRGIQLGGIGDGATTEEAAPTTTSPETSTATTTSAPATEASASLLPIGATVGSAGLATMPYQLTFRGSFFEIADFLASIDGLVNPKEKNISSDGRLVTVDQFELGPDPKMPYPVLSAKLTVTTYVVPPNQGATAGATPSGPGATAAGLAEETQATSAPVSP